MRALRIIVSLVLCIHSIYGQLSGIDLGYSNVLQDTIAGDTVLESGSVPTWLNGSLLRQSCGAYGETGSTSDEANRITHLLDCIEMGQSFRFDNGEVTFYNRYFDTAIVDIWKSYNMNMNESKVFWRTIFTEMDSSQLMRYYDQLEDDTVRTKVRQVPHVTWWQLGDKVMAHSEYPQLVEVDAHEVTNSLYYHQFDDNNFGYTDEAIVDEMSHEAMDRDGTLYCSHQTYRFNPIAYVVYQWKNVYKVVGNERITVARLPYPDLDLRNCDGENPYPIGAHRQGYMHSFTMSENYIIVPESSYLTDICSVIPFQDPHAPFYSQFMDWDGDVPSRIWVVRKSDGEIMASINTTAFFVTHQMNAWEENGMIHADMITYNYGQFYTRDTYVDTLRSTDRYEAYLHRFTIDMSTWTLTRSNIMPNHEPIELPMINQDYLMRPYNYVYYTHGIHTGLPQIFTKLNIHTLEMIEYPMPDGFFPQEPTYLPYPGATAEDDGIVLLAGLDSVQAKGFLMIFNASDLTLMTHLTGSDLMLMGLHSKYFPSNIGVMTPPPTSTTSTQSTEEPETETDPNPNSANALSMSALLVMIGAIFWNCIL